MALGGVGDTIYTAVVSLVGYVCVCTAWLRSRLFIFFFFHFRSSVYRRGTRAPLLEAKINN